jgi:ribonuclease D
MVTVVNGDIPSAALEASQQVKTVGMDIETSRLEMVNGKLDKTNGKIAMVQLYIPMYGTVMVRNLDTYPTNLSQLLESERTTKIFHYGSFDLYFLMRDLMFVFPTNVADTKIAAAFYDPDKKKFKDKNGIGSHKLATLVENVFGYVMDKSIAVSDWFAEDLTPEQLTYAAKDVEYLPKLLEHMETRISPALVPDLLAAYRFLPHKVMIDLKVGRDVFAYQ